MPFFGLRGFEGSFGRRVGGLRASPPAVLRGSCWRTGHPWARSASSQRYPTACLHGASSPPRAMISEALFCLSRSSSWLEQVFRHAHCYWQVTIQNRASAKTQTPRVQSVLTLILIASPYKVPAGMQRSPSHCPGCVAQLSNLGTHSSARFNGNHTWGYGLWAVLGTVLLLDPNDSLTCELALGGCSSA